MPELPRYLQPGATLSQVLEKAGVLPSELEQSFNNAVEIFAQQQYGTLLDRIVALEARVQSLELLINRV